MHNMRAAPAGARFVLGTAEQEVNALYTKEDGIKVKCKSLQAVTELNHKSGHYPCRDAIAGELRGYEYTPRRWRLTRKRKCSSPLRLR